MIPVLYLRPAIAFFSLSGIGYVLWLRGFLYHAEGFVRPGGLSRVTLGDYTSLVNVFIGTTEGGHVFPGATLPHGMVKVGMDTDSPERHAGYDAVKYWSATGFSQMHDDGTGGAVPLSNFKLFPLPECKSFDKCNTTLSARKTTRVIKDDGTADDFGSPGYFATNLTSGVRVELTATRRSALHRYTFPPKPEGNATDWQPRLIVDITNDGQQSGMIAKVNIDPETGRVTGSAKFMASFGRGLYSAYVCADFRSALNLSEALQPAEYGVYTGGNILINKTTFPQQGWGERGALLTFDPPASPTLPVDAINGTTSARGVTILARVGVSFLSSEKACANAEGEIPDFDFDRVHSDARREWNELLGRFDVEVDEHEAAVLFYSSLYRSHIVPADYSDENPLWFSDEPYFDSLYCNWDTYRTLFPLMSLHDPETFARIVRSFIDIQQHEGWLPECRGATLQQYIQGGSSGDPIVAELYIKYKDYMRELGIDPQALYTALIQDAEVQSPDWAMMGRQANAWKEYGYLPFNLPNVRGGMDTRHVSRTLEYAYDDFTISQVAKVMGKTTDGAKYANRSRGFELVWNPETEIMDDNGTVVEGIKGFMQLRYANGTFQYTDPRHCTVHDPTHSTCYLDGFNKDGFYEGGPIVYSQYVPHDTAKLIELQGGDEAFIRRLDYIFDNGYFDSTNEPSQQIPFMYHYANRPGLSTERSRQTISQSYNTSVNGLPGNDDSGAMGSFVAFHLLGLYPLPATRQFLISSPYFSRVTIRNPFLGSETTINARGFEGNPRDGMGKVYVKSVTIDGKPWKSNCFIEWDVFARGGVVDLELTSNKTLSCGEDALALPPSLSTGGYD